MTHKATILTNFNNQKAPFVVYPQEWQGDTIRFYFEDERYYNSGFIDFNAATAQVGIQTDKPYTQFAKVEELNQYLVEVAKLFIKYYHYGWSPRPEEMPKYDESYYKKSGYLEPGAHELQVKAFQAKIIVDLATPVKALVAGCVSGELVRELRSKGVDAWGFDILPHIEKHAHPEVKDFVVSGSVQAVPFGPEDAFDTCIAIDVLEHIPERDISQVVSEWVRLGVKKVVTLINFNQFNFAGHITLRPPAWWQHQFEAYFKLEKTFQLKKETLYHNDHDYNHQWMVFSR